MPAHRKADYVSGQTISHMLSFEKLNTDDLRSVKAIPRSFQTTIFVYSMFLIPMAFLLGLLGLQKKGYGYWPTTFLFLLCYVFVILWTLIKSYVAYKQDLKKQVKIVGTITVVKKKDNVIFTDTKELKKFELFPKDSFDKIDTGDKLTIEITKYSKRLLLLEKSGINLRDGR